MKEKDIFSALTCEWRLKILDILREGEKCQCEIVKNIPLDPTTLSRHISVLKRAGILEERKMGRNKVLRVRDERIFQIIDLARGMIG